MTTLPPPYDADEPIPAGAIATAPLVHTAVVSRTDFPMHEMPSLMDGTFSHLVPALEEVGIAPIGPAFSLHRRMPVDTADLEVGFPVDGHLTQTLALPSGFEVRASVLPAGRVAAASHVGGYDGLAEAWGAFTAQLGEAGEQMAFPFWEFYVTAPTPDIDPATLRTDLFTLLAPRED